MEYDDFSLPKKADFEKLAKGYVTEENKAKNKQDDWKLLEVNPAILDSVCYSLKFLNWLYTHIKRNLRGNKLGLFFDELAKKSEKDFEDFEGKFYDFPKRIKIYKSKKINSLNSCLKLAIYTETELIENIFKLFKCDNCDFLEPVLADHFAILKRLSSI